MFTEKVTTYNVLENQRVSFVCRGCSSNTYDMVEVYRTDKLHSNHIVTGSELNSEFKDRFYYSNRYDNSILIPKNINRNQTGYLYLCVCHPDMSTKSLIINVYYPPNNPVCQRLNNSNGQVILECTVEEAVPIVYLAIAGSTKTYKPHSYTRTKTHVSQQVIVNDDATNYKCIAIQFYPYDIATNNLIYDKQCTFN